jgi:GGDEF domain-containing protein
LLDISVMRDEHGAPGHRIAQVQDITQRRRLERRLERLADEDALTGLLNRHRFVSEIELRIAPWSSHHDGALFLFR